MENCIIDASIAAKWVFLEKYSNEAEEFLKGISTKLVPVLFAIEMDSIITKKVRRRELTVHEAIEKRGQIKDLHFEFIYEESVLKLAFDISISLPITIYDANYLALAVEKNGVLYTADDKLIRGLSNTIFTDYVKNPLF